MPLSHSSSTVKGKDLFSSQLWTSPVATAAFYKLIASLRQFVREDVKAVSPTHRFLRTLRERRKLIRVYSQNIDGLESRAGLTSDLSKGKGLRGRFARRAMDSPKSTAHSSHTHESGCEVVQLHGDLSHVRCTQCSSVNPWDPSCSSLFKQGLAPPCPECSTTSEIRSALGKRTCSTKIGSLRPDIVLYGEEHMQADAISAITQWDLGSKPDLLLILGTSLHVHGLKVLVREFAKAVRLTREGKKETNRPGVVYVNLTKPSDSIWGGIIDTWINMPCDDWVATVKRMRPDIWNIQTRLTGKVLKPKSSTPAESLTRKPTNNEVIADSEEETMDEDDGDKENAHPNSTRTYPPSLKTSLMEVLKQPPPATLGKPHHITKNAVPHFPLTPPPSSTKSRKRPLAELEDHGDSAVPTTPSKRQRLPLTPPGSSSSTTIPVERERKSATVAMIDGEPTSVSPADNQYPSTPTKNPCRRGRLPGRAKNRRTEEVFVHED